MELSEKLNKFMVEMKDNLKNNDIGDYLNMHFNKMLKADFFDPLPNGYAYEYIYEEYIGGSICFKKLEKNTLVTLGSVDLTDMKVDNYWEEIENYGRDGKERELVDTYFVEPIREIAECLVQYRIDYLKDSIEMEGLEL